MTIINIRKRRKEVMRRFLIGKGLNGVSQADFLAKMRTYNRKTNPNGIKYKEIEEILDLWAGRNLVQKFSIRTSISKKPVIMWRATQNIVNADL